jgi:hypothetical protein
MKILSIHLSKTAGTTFRKIIEQVYEPHEVYFDYEETSNSNEPKSLTPNVKIIHGHFGPNKYNQIFPDSMKLTWVRHPIARIISHYFFWKTVRKGSTLFNMERMSLIEFAERPEIQNHMNACLGDIKELSFIGVQEFFADDLQDIANLLSWKNYQIEQVNQNRFPKYLEYCQEIWSDTETIKKIADCNTKDMELYEYVLELRALRRKELKGVHQFYVSWEKSQLELLQAMIRITKLEKFLQNVESCLQSSLNSIQNLQSELHSSLTSEVQGSDSQEEKLNQFKPYFWKQGCSERANDDITNRDDVYYSYRLFLSREPDSKGMEYWVNRSNCERIYVDDFALIVIHSNEFESLYFNSTEHSFQKIAEDDVEKYVFHGYRFFSGHSPSSEELQNWIERVCNNKMTTMDLTSEFIKAFGYSLRDF